MTEIINPDFELHVAEDSEDIISGLLADYLLTLPSIKKEKFLTILMSVADKCPTDIGDFLVLLFAKSFRKDKLKYFCKE